jgi:probable addiction module antidote protein
MTRKRKPYADYHEFLINRLRDPLEAASYLKAALADEDERIFLIAMRNVLEAQGGSIPSLAEETHLNKQNLYRMLSKTGNPRFNSLKTVLHAIGFELSLSPIKR